MWQYARNLVGSVFDRLKCELSIASDRLNVCVAQKLSDRRQPLARGDCGQSEGVPAVMDPEVFQSGASPW